MASKVRVYGKAQNRTSLGIMHAYHVMYPHAKMADFEKAFPKELNPDSSWPSNFKTLDEVKKIDEKSTGFWFAEPDEVIKLQDGTQMCVVKMWTKPSFERLVSHASQYDIEIAKFEEGQRGEKGGFRLEYLNGYVPPKPEKSKTWLWILLGALVVVAVLLALLMRSCNKEPQVVEVEKIVKVVDTVYVQQIQEIEKNFNAAEFEKGKTDLSDASKFVLHDLATLMSKQENIKLKIVGHTSAEGTADFNQKLSEDRAKAAVDFLISQGVAEDRLQWEGKGSSELKDAANPESNVNRRTEFIVLE